MNLNFVKICMAVVGMMTLCGTVMAADLPKWPLYNGDFSIWVGGHLPVRWNIGINSGQFNYKMEPLKDANANPALHRNTSAPHEIAVESLQSGEAYIFQNLELMKGRYRLSAEVTATPAAKGRLSIWSPGGEQQQASSPVELKQTPQTLQFEVEAPQDETAIALFLNCSAGDKVAIHNFKVEVLRLDSAPVPVEDGSSIGGLVLPAQPSQAEQFACYELQRYISQMTGRVPGLKGRDEVYPGRLIYIGKASETRDKQQLQGKNADSYVIRNEENQVTLASETDQGVLYAVYDYLKQQGCRWILPGKVNEVVPTRKALLPVSAKTEEPAYNCRGAMVVGIEFFPGGGQEKGWNAIDKDEYFDWFLRNRMNAIWFAESASYDFGAHRGHGWVQLLNHSYNSLIAPHEQYFQSHPEWYALVRGKRTAVSDIPPFLGNQLCVSSPTLRDYTVKMALDYFKSHPAAKAFPMNPMDEPVQWCECSACKELDPPGLDWAQNTPGHMRGMTDRALNYANYVAEQVSKSYPGKFIEMYAYSYTLQPPKREKVHPNVMIKFANFEGYGSLGKSTLDATDSRWVTTTNLYRSWRKTEIKHQALYNYFDWIHPDASLYWFYNTSDLLKSLHSEFGFEGILGETTSNPKISPLLYQVMAQSLWNPQTDYKQVIRDVSDAYYGVATDTMQAFYLLMDREIEGNTASLSKDWRPTDHLYLSLEALEKGRVLLEEAMTQAQGNRSLTERIAYASFGHAYLTYVRAANEKNRTRATANVARQAFDRANALRSEYNIMMKAPDQLKSFYYPPLSNGDEVILELPVTWDFKLDPEKIGDRDQWYVDGGGEWSQIAVGKDWTSQDVGRGYHGTAWYRLDFTLPPGTAKQSPLAIYFGAVDGKTEVFLDGVKLGEPEGEPDTLWDKPFQLDLPTDFDPAKPHRLAVKVTKDRFAAGIWKMVKIVPGAANE